MPLRCCMQLLYLSRRSTQMLHSTSSRSVISFSWETILQLGFPIRTAGKTALFFFSPFFASRSGLLLGF